jgi:hypothetical protein
MPANQNREGSLIAVLAEELQQLSVGQISGRSRIRCPAEVIKRRRQVFPGHASILHPKEVRTINKCVQRDLTRQLFGKKSSREREGPPAHGRRS